MDDLKIFEQGPGQWPKYLVSADWSEAWTIQLDSDRIFVGRAGRSNFMYGRRGVSVGVDTLPDDAVVQILKDDAVIVDESN